MDNFSAVLGGAASALAVFAALVAAYRWARARRQRRRLRRTVELAQAASRQLRSTVVAIDHRMSEGVGWTGWAIWPDLLGPHIADLDMLILDTEATAARVRGSDVETRLERLRADVEACLLLLRCGAEIYRGGTVANYRAIEGRPVPPGATGRDVTAALRLEDETLLRDTCRDFTHLVRSCLYQVGSDDEARSFEAGWPVNRAEILAADPAWEIPQFPEGTDLAPPFGAW